MRLEIFLSALALLGLAGCALPPLAPTARIELKQSPEDTAGAISTLAGHCWTRSANPLRSGIVVDARQRLDGVRSVRAFRVTHSAGRSSDAFFEARIVGEGPTTVVELMETCYEYGFVGCRKLDMTRDVQQWLKGERSCESRIW